MNAFELDTGIKGYFNCKAGQIGRGASSTVFRGFTSSSLLALKLVQGQTAAANEIATLKKIKHKNAVDFFGHSQLANQTILAMEYCPDGSLWEFLQEPENYFGLDDENFVIVLMDLTSAIQYLHKNNQFHRDIKPHNILRVITEEGPVMKIADFGHTKELEHEENIYHSNVGTIQYMHPVSLAYLHPSSHLPEADQKQKTGRTDLWSVAVTLYQLATGMFPFFCNKLTSLDCRLGLTGIYKKKTDKDIGGYFDHNNEVVLSSALPETSALSLSLRRMLETLLQKLFCVDQSVSFSDFFDSAQRIIDSPVFSIVTVERTSETSLSADLHRIWGQDELVRFAQLKKDSLLIDRLSHSTWPSCQLSPDECRQNLTFTLANERLLHWKPSLFLLTTERLSNWQLVGGCFRKKVTLTKPTNCQLLIFLKMNKTNGQIVQLEKDRIQSAHELTNCLKELNNRREMVNCLSDVSRTITDNRLTKKANQLRLKLEESGKQLVRLSNFVEHLPRQLVSIYGEATKHFETTDRLPDDLTIYQKAIENVRNNAETRLAVSDELPALVGLVRLLQYEHRGGRPAGNYREALGLVDQMLESLAKD